VPIKTIDDRSIPGLPFTDVIYC